MKIVNDNFTVRFDPDRSTVFLSGTLRLQGRDEYRAISRLLNESAETSDGTLVIDMQDLEFLNSSGISTLSLFVIEMRKRGKPLRIVGSAAVSWQAKSLHNFQRLYAAAEVKIIRPEDA